MAPPPSDVAVAPDVVLPPGEGAVSAEPALAAAAVAAGDGTPPAQDGSPELGGQQLPSGGPSHLSTSRKLAKRNKARAAVSAAALGESRPAGEAQGLPSSKPQALWGSGMEGLDLFPMQATTLDPSTKLADLDEQSRELVFEYLAGCMKGSPELRTIFESIHDEAPQSLRLKEIFETVESFKQAAAFAVIADKVKPVETLYDLACGHGLLGVLLAYNFPKKRVVCVDLEQRAGFEVWLRAFERLGEPRDPKAASPDVLGNLSFVVGDLAATLDDGSVRAESLVLAVHACHEANQRSIEGARKVGAAWGVMPCCIRDGIYLPCGVKGSKAKGNEDDLRHAIMCGAVGATYGVERMNCIDRRITNRNIFLFGGVGFGSREAYLQSCGTCG
mmetsp:Transcript_106676/g.270899  ORF Transcript_106676/g.270899 Transcript_106676/m.270899 type:complete len:388 (-) Transcript_106676:358-1521(-)